MQTDFGTDRLLRLVVGTLLLGVAMATYTEQLSVSQSLLLSVALVVSVLVSAISRHTPVKLPPLFQLGQYRR